MLSYLKKGTVFKQPLEGLIQYLCLKLLRVRFLTDVGTQ